MNDAFNELIFENRHKQYGAYQLRKLHRKALLIGILLNFFIFLGLMVYVWLQKEEHVPQKQEEEREVMISMQEVVLEDIENLPVVETPPTPEKPKNSDNENIDTEENEEQPKTKKEITIKNAEKKEIEKDTNTTKKSVSTDSTPAVAYSPDVWSIYLKKNIRYPERGLQEKKECRVFVAVFILPDGSLEIDKDRALYGCEEYFNEEVKRLVTHAPRFLPDLDEAGKPKRTRRNLSILFELPKP